MKSLVPEVVTSRRGLGVAVVEVVDFLVRNILGNVLVLGDGVKVGGMTYR